MSSRKRVALVTGCDNPTMTAVAETLCASFTGDVIVTGTSSDASNKYETQLYKKGFKPRFIMLDITDRCEISNLKTFLQDNYNGIDILFHNGALVKFSDNKPGEFAPCVKETLNKNFFGTVTLIQRLWPLLRPHSRVCLVTGCRIREIFSECSLDLQLKMKEYCTMRTMGDLKVLMEELLFVGQKGIHFRLGWPNDVFRISQLANVLAASILNRKAMSDYRGDIQVTSCVPGTKSTDLFGFKVPLSPTAGISH